jgi:adenylate cyclase
MTEKRQLLAIMFTDIVGYTAMMGESEPKTLEVLKRNRELHHRFIRQFRGEYLQEIGDGTLASFESAVDAVDCALELQRSIQGNPDLNLRVGIHLGDVISKDGDVIGDAVNIASRIEPLAATGGICVSGNVYESLRNKPGIEAIFVGPKSLKNVSEPVRVYGLTGGGLPSPERIRKAAQKVPTVGSSSKTKLAAAVVVLAAAAGLWFGVFQRGPSVEPASEANMAFPLPNKPSIAVLPFDNMSGDPEQEYFSDGLTEDIITGLAKVTGLFVIARNSTFTYKEKPVRIQQVSEDLGVRYVLEGSVRRSGGDVRITAQLIDALTGHHLWAQKYDRDMEDLFALQDEITDEVVTALSVELTEGEQMRVWRDHTRSLEAWEHMARGQSHFHRFAKADNTAARRAFESSVEADPDYALAFAMLAWTHWMDAMHGWSQSREQSIGRAAELAQRALALDDSLPDVYALLGAIKLLNREYDEAIAVGTKAVALNPNHSNNVALLANTLRNAGQPREAIRRFKEAMRLSPYYPDWYLEALGAAFLEAGQYEEAIAVSGKFLERKPSAEHAAHAYLEQAEAYAALGREPEARAAVAAALGVDPGISATSVEKRLLRKDRAAAGRSMALLRGLGLPE